MLALIDYNHNGIYDPPYDANINPRTIGNLSFGFMPGNRKVAQVAAIQPATFIRLALLGEPHERSTVDLTADGSIYEVSFYNEINNFYIYPKGVSTVGKIRGAYHFYHMNFALNPLYEAWNSDYSMMSALLPNNLSPKPVQIIFP